MQHFTLFHGLPNLLRALKSEILGARVATMSKTLILVPWYIAEGQLDVSIKREKLDLFVKVMFESYKLLEWHALILSFVWTTLGENSDGEVFNVLNPPFLRCAAITDNTFSKPSCPHCPFPVTQKTKFIPIRNFFFILYSTYFLFLLHWSFTSRNFDFHTTYHLLLTDNAGNRCYEITRERKCLIYARTTRHCEVNKYLNRI